VCVGHARRGRGGGVSILLRETCKNTARPTLLLQDGTLGIVCIALAPPGCRPLHVVCSYLAHKASTAIGTDTASRTEALTAFYDTLTDLRAAASRVGADFIVAGDLNSRTGQLSETDRPALDGDLPPELATYTRCMQLAPPRSNIDTFTDPIRGPALVDFCGANGLAILNGRLPGDEDGMLTFLSAAGCSTVDYVISNAELCFTDTGRVRFGSTLTVLTDACNVRATTNACFDHAPLLFTVVAREAESTRLEAAPAPGRITYRFDRGRQAAYAHALQQSSILPQVLSCNDSTTAHDLLQQAIKAAAAASGMEHTRTGSGRGRGPRQQPWFDSVCKELRDAHWETVRMHGANSEQARVSHRVYFRHIRITKRAWQDKELAEMVDTYKHNPLQFWKDWKAKHGKHVHLGIDCWTKHFRSILGKPNTKPLVGGTVESHCTAHEDMFPAASDLDRDLAVGLNCTISVGEVSEALALMKNGKAAGVDGISAEFLRHSTDPRIIDSMSALVTPITHLFNTVFSGEYPAQWGTCTVTPVPKKGDPQDPNNYRGIAVSTALAKLFSMVMYLRLDHWAEDTKRRAAGQAGFRKGRSTTDGIFVLQHCIESCRATKKELYVAFIDFEKAYDSINRDLLWQALACMGVHGLMLDCLRKMHAEICFTAKENGVCGEPFRVESGVKQGDPLSPLLFGLFIDRLEAYLQKELPHVGVSVVSAIINSLLYADDLALLSVTETGLQGLLDALSRFAKANQLTVNIAKCKCVAFNKSSRREVQFSYDGHSIANADWFDYLGTRFYKSYKSTKAHVSKNLTIRLAKAETALTLLRRRCGELDIHSVALRCNLFNALVSSVLASGSEVWGVYHMHKWLTSERQWGMGCEVEKLHRRFLRWAFGMLPQSVDSVVLLQEAGRVPLMHGWLKQTLTWYNRVVKTYEEGDIVHKCLRESIGSALPDTWGRTFHSVLTGIDAEGAHNVACREAVHPSSVLFGLQCNWEASWPLMQDVQAVLVRDIEQSQHFKFITYSKWFKRIRIIYLCITC